MNARQKLRSLVSAPGYVIAPGAHDTLTARLVANERLSVNHAGQVVLKLKTPYRDGASHINMSPLEFMQRLAALVPRPRLTSDRLSRGAGASCPTACRDCAGPGAADNRARHRLRAFERHAPGVVRAAAATHTGAARRYVSGGLIV